MERRQTHRRRTAIDPCIFQRLWLELPKRHWGRGSEGTAVLGWQTKRKQFVIDVSEQMMLFVGWIESVRNRWGWSIRKLNKRAVDYCLSHANTYAYEVYLSYGNFWWQKDAQHQTGIVWSSVVPVFVGDDVWEVPMMRKAIAGGLVENIYMI